jgi:hypothetical protein
MHAIDLESVLDQELAISLSPRSKIIPSSFECEENPGSAVMVTHSIERPVSVIEIDFVSIKEIIHGSSNSPVRLGE